MRISPLRALQHWGWILLCAGTALPPPSPLSCRSPSVGWGGSRAAGSPFAEPATAPRVRRCRMHPIALQPLNRLLSGGVSPERAEDPFLQAGLWGAGPDATQLFPASPAEISPLGSKTSPSGERTGAEPPPLLIYSCSIPGAERAGDSQSLATRLPWIISDEHFAFREGYKMLERAFFPRLPLQSFTRRTDNKEDTAVHVPIIAGQRAPAGSSRSPALIAYADTWHQHHQGAALVCLCTTGFCTELGAGGREGFFFHVRSRKTNALLLWIICFMQVSNSPA